MEKDYEKLVEEILKMNSFDVFSRIQGIYMELEQYSGKISEDNRDFLIAYMQSGIMNEDDIDDYILVSSHHPELNLPNVYDY